MIKNIKIEEIYTPISGQLILLEESLENIIQNLCCTNIKNVFKHSFKIPGKRLRPALLLLSAQAVTQKSSPEVDFQLIQLAAALELIHTASLIHDDVIDTDLTRRGQKTLNNVFGNKMAVLAGDVLHSHAFLIIARQFPKEYQNRAVQMIETMCLAEMDQIGVADIFPSKEEYLNIINGKTASFMSNCCRFGANLAGASSSEIACLENYGLNFGMAYQVIDDYIDKDPVSIRHVGLKEADEYACQAKDSIRILEDTVYKQKLIDFLQYILNYAH